MAADALSPGEIPLFALMDGRERAALAGILGTRRGRGVDAPDRLGRVRSLAEVFRQFVQPSVQARRRDVREGLVIDPRRAGAQV